MSTLCAISLLPTFISCFMIPVGPLVCEVGGGVAGMGEQAADRTAPARSRRSSSSPKEHVGELGLCVEGGRRVFPFAVEVVEMNEPAGVHTGADRHDAGVTAGPQPVEQQAGEREVGQVVAAQLQLETLLGQ